MGKTSIYLNKEIEQAINELVSAGWASSRTELIKKAIIRVYSEYIGACNPVKLSRELSDIVKDFDSDVLKKIAARLRYCCPSAARAFEMLAER